VNRRKKLPLFNEISVPPFTALLIENWNATPHRYFLAYRTLGNFRHVLGLPVVDEYATFSTPIFFGPIPLLGQLYNVGITLGHQRDPEMGLDQGWPPICVGIESDQLAKPGWEEQLLSAIKNERPKEDQDLYQSVRIGNVDVFASKTPLLPRQLRRICQISKMSFAIAFSTGNRISGKKGKLLNIEVASEREVDNIIHKFSTENHTG
jgi:hypothetical protein